ncbi:unnamed protein product [Arctogadus glacialis]
MEVDIPEPRFFRTVTHLQSSTHCISFKDMRKLLESLVSLTHLELSDTEKWINRGLLKTACSIPSLRSLDLHYNSVVNIAQKLPNCSQITKLDLFSNRISNLSSHSIQSMKQLRYLDLAEVLDLSRNTLKNLDFLAQANLTSLRCLKLCENELTVIDHHIFQFLPALTYLDLSVNPLTCDCSNSGFLLWALSSDQTQIVNVDQYVCTYPLSERGTMFVDVDVHSCWMDASFLCYISTTGLVLLTLLTAFGHHFLHWRLDEAWVHGEMLPALEDERGWRLCLHHRDFQPGRSIMENITEAIYGSRKTICVISRHYLESEWCSREIQMARAVLPRDRACRDQRHNIMKTNCLFVFCSQK